MTATRNVLGPLTTVFTPNPTCTIPLITYLGDSAAIGYMGQSCTNVHTSYSIVDQSLCWPTWTAGAATSATPEALNGWGFYSPGLKCPAGYSSACSSTAGGKGNYKFQFPPTTGETVVGCCPKSYACHSQQAQTCLQVVTSAHNAAVVCSGATNSLTNIVLPTLISSTPIYTYSLYAPLIQLNWKATDRPSTAKSTSSTSGTTTVVTTSTTMSAASSRAASDIEVPGSGQGLTVGEKAGIGVGAGVGCLIFLWAIVWLFRRRWGTRFNPKSELSVPNTLPPTSVTQQTDYIPQNPQFGYPPQAPQSSYTPQGSHSSYTPQSPQSGHTPQVHQSVYTPVLELAGNEQYPKHLPQPMYEVHRPI